MPTATDTGKYDVLLCYNNVDVAEVKRLHAALGPYGIHCWIDYDQLIPGGFWREGVKQGLAQSEFVIVILGPAGAGMSQIDEIRYIIETCRGRNKHFIPVLLPGADKSPLDEIGSLGRTYIQASEHADEQQVVERILGAVNPRALALARCFGLFRGINPRPRSCFLALPRVANSDLLPVFCDVAGSMQCATVQDADATLPGYEADVLKGVANTSLVLADGRCPEGTNHLDPSVSHVLGIARAYGKPILLVIDPRRKPVHPNFTARPLDYVPDSAGGLSELKQQLELNIRETLSSLKFHGMLSPDAQDMLVISHSALRLNPSQWKYVGQSVNTCKVLADGFSSTGHLLSELSVIPHQAEAAEEEWPRNSENQRWWREFTTVFRRDYCRLFSTRLVPLLHAWSERQVRLTATVAQLAGEKTDIGKAFGNARDFLALMAKGITRFGKVHEILQEKLLADSGANGEAWPLGPAWYHKELVTMRDYADDVVTNALAAITSFLPLLGHEAEPIQGVPNYAYDQQSVGAGI